MSAPGPSLLVSEIYRSIQGESSWVGLPCVFVRLAGCNLRCVWCDSAFTFQGGERLSVAEVLARVRAQHAPLVELTGGEPLLQAEVHALIAALLAVGHTVLLETGGSLDLAPVDPRVIKIVDIKCPDSGEAHRNRWENLEHLQPHDELKFVLASRADYEWARRTIEQRGLTGRAGLLMGPVHGALEPHRLVEWILSDGLPVRFQLQLHKVVWPPEARGV